MCEYDLEHEIILFFCFGVHASSFHRVHNLQSEYATFYNIYMQYNHMFPGITIQHLSFKNPSA